MSWPIDAPETLAERIGGTIEAAFPGVDARSSGTVLGILSGVLGEELYGVLLHHQRLAQEA